MQPTTDTDYKKLFSQLIKKQILVLGPDITLAKVRNVPGLVVDQSGEVQGIEGDSQAMLQALINQFVELSGMIVKKTMESILTSYPGMAGMAVNSMGMGSAAATASSDSSQATSALEVPSVPSVPAKAADAPVVVATPPSEAESTSIPAPSVDVAVNAPTSQGASVPEKPPVEHKEPPSMAEIGLTSTGTTGAPAPETPKKEESAPASFSKKEMDELNKALEQLSNAPLSTENTQSQAASAHA